MLAILYTTDDISFKILACPYNNISMGLTSLFGLYSPLHKHIIITMNPTRA